MMESSQKIIFDAQLTQKEYVSLNIQHQKKSLVIGFVVYTLIFFLVVNGMNRFQLDRTYILIGIFGGLLLSLIIIVFIYSWIVFQAKRHFKSDKILQHKQTYEISDAGIIIESISGNWKVQWEEVLKVIESKGIIAIYVGRIRALILPKEVIRIQRNDGLHIIKGILIKNLPKSKVKFVSNSGGQ